MKDGRQNFSYIFVILFSLTLVLPTFSQFNLSMWTMSNDAVTKPLLVPAVIGFPENMVEMQRKAIEGNGGDIVFGIRREDNTEAQNPTIENGELIFSGGQTAYIENVFSEIAAFYKIAFNFTPADISSIVNIFDVPWSFQVQMEPHSGGSTARLRFYVYNDRGVVKSVKTDYEIIDGQSYNIECWLENGYMNISLNGTILEGQWDKGRDTFEGSIAVPTHPSLFIGSRWDGNARWFKGRIDNIKFFFYCDDDCKDWGFLKADLNRDKYVDISDYAKFAEFWSNCTSPNKSGCLPAWNLLKGDEGFGARRERLLAGDLGLAGSIVGKMPQMPTDNPDNIINLYGSYSAMCLRLGFHISESNAVIRRIAEWFEHPHPRGLDLQGEVDFAALELARLYVSQKTTGVLEHSTIEVIESFFLEYDFKSMWDSENHTLVFRASRYLMANQLPDEMFLAYGKTGTQLYAEDGEFLKQFIRFRAKRGWGEFDSANYQMLVFNTLLTLYEHSDDAELKELCTKMANVLLVDMAVDSLNGLYGGARGRVPEDVVLDHAKSVLNNIQYLYFDISDPESESGQDRLLGLERLSRWETMNKSLFSSFRPMDIVKKIATERNTSYMNKERKHLHNMEDTLPINPLDGSIRKYTWYTPQYILGSVQLQDPYPEGLASGSYAKNQQHDWDFSIASGTQTKIFTHHPGDYHKLHSYWRGDLNCLCTNTFQNQTVVLAVFDIKPEKPYQYIHAYLPRAVFDEVVEDSGWIFVRKGDVYAALYLTGGYRWVTAGQWSNVEVISDGSKKASVFEAGLAADFGTFTAFRNEIKTNTVSFDAVTMTLTYDSQRGDKIKINGAGLRQVDDADVDLNYQTYDSPYMQSQWDSGVITLKYGGDEAVLDFN